MPQLLSDSVPDDTLTFCALTCIPVPIHTEISFVKHSQGQKPLLQTIVDKVKDVKWNQKTVLPGNCDFTIQLFTIQFYLTSLMLKLISLMLN